MLMVYARPAILSLQAMTADVLLAKTLWNVFWFTDKIKLTQTTEQKLQLFTIRQRNRTLHCVRISAEGSL